MEINLELYKVFYYVATTLSFSEASRQLFISQSAVSQSVKALEQKLNHTLFIRSTKKVLLTPEGELLLSHVKPAMKMLEDGESLVTGGNLLTGQLRIGASDTICRYFLIDYFRRFHQNYPDVRIKVTNSTSVGCVDLLKNGQVDLIICNYPNSRLDKQFHMKIIKDFQDIFVANPAYFHIQNTPLNLDDLLEYPILMLSQESTTSEYLKQFFARHNMKLLPEAELSSNDLLTDLARIGLGITCVPDYMLKNMDSLVRIPLKEDLPKRHLVLVQNQNLPVSQTSERFVEMFQTL
ncbi:MAG: LysR family transcriptional regulator [Clostridia bacterium]|nr:LysR family transcriptional regulator [Clostridia bacterium]MDY5555358.1 LysR family transcriptional regulator [Blautia sp.]